MACALDKTNLINESKEAASIPIDKYTYYSNRFRFLRLNQPISFLCVLDVTCPSQVLVGEGEDGEVVLGGVESVLALGGRGLELLGQ